MLARMPKEQTMYRNICRGKTCRVCVCVGGGGRRGEADGQTHQAQATWDTQCDQAKQGQDEGRAHDEARTTYHGTVREVVRRQVAVGKSLDEPERRERDLGNRNAVVAAGRMRARGVVPGGWGRGGSAGMLVPAGW